MIHVKQRITPDPVCISNGTLIPTSCTTFDQSPMGPQLNESCQTEDMIWGYPPGLHRPDAALRLGHTHSSTLSHMLYDGVSQSQSGPHCGLETRERLVPILRTNVVCVPHFPVFNHFGALPTYLTVLYSKQRYIHPTSQFQHEINDDVY